MDMWEGYEMVPGESGRVGFKTNHGRFLCANAEGELVADREDMNAWEGFYVIVRGAVTLLSHQK